MLNSTFAVTLGSFLPKLILLLLFPLPLLNDVGITVIYSCLTLLSVSRFIGTEFISFFDAVPPLFTSSILLIDFIRLNGRKNPAAAY
jgi:hypothetical protein